MRSFRPSPLLWTTLTAILAFGLGYIGYRQSMSADLNRFDAAYRAMQLFVLDSQPESDAPWELRVARFVAPLSLITAAVVTAAAFLRDQYQRTLIALLARDHVVVVGLSTSSGAVAESMVQLSQRVVVIEANSDHPRLSGLRATGALCVVGDGRQAITLRRARVGRARHVVVSTGDDAVNMEIADRVRAVRRGDESRHTTVHVAIDDVDLWLEVGRLTVGRRVGGTSVECFNKADRTARRLIDVAAAVSGLDRVAVVGSGAEADRATAHLTRMSHLRDSAVEVSSSPDDQATTVIVCGSRQSLGDAITIARRHPKVEVVVSVDTETAHTLAEMIGDLSQRVHVVPTSSASLAVGFLQDSAIEIMARAKHADYVGQETARGLTQADNSSLLPWDELPEALRDSNRRFAASIADTLGAIGATLEPLQGNDVGDLQITTADLEVMAIREHERWQADLIQEGWSHTSGPKDPSNKRHPLLVPWQELSEEEREKDRDAVRAIPVMLARAGYELRYGESR